MGVARRAARPTHAAANAALGTGPPAVRTVQPQGSRRVLRGPGRRIDELGPPEPIVVKVAPPGLKPTRNRDVLRQARIIEVLGSVQGVRVPSVLFSDAGEPPEVPPFFAMSYVPGESVEPITHPTDDIPDAD